MRSLFLSGAILLASLCANPVLCLPLSGGSYNFLVQQGTNKLAVVVNTLNPEKTVAQFLKTGRTSLQVDKCLPDQGTISELGRLIDVAWSRLQTQGRQREDLLGINFRLQRWDAKTIAAVNKACMAMGTGNFVLTGGYQNQQNNRRAAWKFLSGTPIHDAVLYRLQDLQEGATKAIQRIAVQKDASGQITLSYTYGKKTVPARTMPWPPRWPAPRLW